MDKVVMRGGYIICKSIVFIRTRKEDKRYTHTHNHLSKIELDEKQNRHSIVSGLER